MSGDNFNGFLETFAGCVEAAGRTTCLIDANQFKMDFEKMSTGWRDANIIPRYNAAGVKKFAFVVPAGAPPTLNPLAPEGPAKFPTGYFSDRVDTLGWLNS